MRRVPGGPFVENLLERTLNNARLSPPNRRLCHELVYGVVRWEATLDWLISHKTEGRTQNATLQNVLRLGLYQLFWLDRIPNHAAVNEAVEQAKQRGFGPQAGFINAVLRGYIRDYDATVQQLADLKRTQPHLGYSHPEWLVARWRERWGPEKTAKLLEWNNTTPKTYARINTLQFDRHRMNSKPGSEMRAHTRSVIRRPFLDRKFNDAGDVLAQWRDEGVEYDFVRGDWFEDNLMFELKSHPHLLTLPSFQHGLFYVQDPSTLLAIVELDPQPGETVLDLCAAPGGKTTYMAQLMENEGRVVAHDTTPERLKLIEENCARLGVTCVRTAAAALSGNAPVVAGIGTTAANGVRAALLPGSFDRVLVDAPCSNTGVMRRRVDLRWRVTLEEIQRLHAAQLELLRQAAALLKPGGTLVYSTCSLEPEENQEVVQAFLAEIKGFEPDYERELLPFKDPCDGAFVARLQRGT